MIDCIVNVGFGGWHPKGSQRLYRSLIYHGFPGRVQCWTEELPPGSPSHSEIPYAMKVYAMKWGFDHYDRVMWLDSSVWCIKYPEVHMKAVARDGYYLLESGWFCDQWTNDNCLAYFGLTREEANAIPMISAGILGIDISTEVGKEFFQRWFKAMEAGAFNGSWGAVHEEGPILPPEVVAENPDMQRYRGHRHDQSCASIIAHQLGMGLHPKETYDMYYQPVMPDTVEFALQGM